MAQVVSISQVIPLRDSSSYGIRKMKAVLQKQGQIEPLQVHKLDSHYIVFPSDAWGNDMIFAARELGWPTLLIVEMPKFEA